MERVNKQKQQARSNNKNKARTYLGGSFGSPSSFRYTPFATRPHRYNDLASPPLLLLTLRKALPVLW